MSFSNIIFLDIDGPLCNSRTNEILPQVTTYYNLHTRLDKHGCELIYKLCKDFDCKIVITSTWREDFKHRFAIVSLFDNIVTGLGERIHQDWRIPEGIGRGSLVEKWIDFHSDEINKYIIIDDWEHNFNLEYQKQRLILVNSDDGILWRDYQKCREFLK